MTGSLRGTSNEPEQVSSATSKMISPTTSTMSSPQTTSRQQGVAPVTAPARRARPPELELQKQVPDPQADSAALAPWLVVSLCDGIGGLFVCLSRLKVPFDAIIAESDTGLRDFVHARFPTAEVFKDALSIDSDLVMKRANKKKYIGILLAGGPPCQPFSLAGRQRGWAESRSSPSSHFCSLQRLLRTRCKEASLRFECLMEQVATMNVENRDILTEKFGEPPVLVQAAEFGWVQRARFYWGVYEQVQQAHGTATVEWEFLPAGKVMHGIGLLRWCGPKVPELWHPRPGWHWVGQHADHTSSVPIPGQHWRGVYKGGRMATLTTAFPHPPDHGAKSADKEQLQRFEDDGRRFPLNTYAKQYCLESKGVLRVMDADEREAIMGYPAGYSNNLQIKGKSCEDARCHAIGSGFHLPSVMLLLAIVLGLPAASTASSSGPMSSSTSCSSSRPSCPISSSSPSSCCAWPASFVHNTEFDQRCGNLDHHATTGEAMMTDIDSMFPHQFFPCKARQRALEKLQKIDWRRLACWRAWSSRCRPQEDTSGPDLEALASKLGNYVATGRQKNIAGAKHTPTTRIPADVDMQEHMRIALSLDHPFTLPTHIEIDTAFAVDACARLGPGAASWRYWVFDAIRKLARALAPLDVWALKHRPTRHCDGWAPVLTAAFVHVLGWRDRDLPWALVAGFHIVGDIPPSGIHRPLVQESTPGPGTSRPPTGQTRNDELRRELLGDNAVNYINKLESNLKIHENADDILEATAKEIDLGLARRFETRDEVDAIFGVGQWRPLPRHVVHQHGKFRPIDNAKASAHNMHTECSEAIVCSSAEWPAVVTKAILLQIAVLTREEDACPPPWLLPQTGTADMWKGFRQNHPTRDDERFCVITFVHPHTGRRVYSRLRGLPFGMGSVVNQFNRLPHLQTAVKRRLLGLLVCHYFDDELLWEVRELAHRSYRLGARLSSLWGIIYSDDKRQQMSSMSDFLGNQYDWTQFAQACAAGFSVKESTMMKALHLIASHQESGKMTPAEASKLRGLLSWVDRGVTGRALRGALTALSARQYWDHPNGHALTPALYSALEYARLVLEVVPPRLIQFRHVQRPHRVLYTDASTDGPTGLRVGIWLLGTSTPTLCSSFDVPSEVIDCWRLRSTYIGQGELLAVPVALTVLRHELQGCMLTWYIDNTSAAASAIKGASPDPDSSPLALVGALLAARLGVSVWVEHVQSAQNPADVMTHEAYGDPAVQQCLAAGSVQSVQPAVRWSDFTSLDSAATLVRRWEQKP